LVLCPSYSPGALTTLQGPYARPDVGVFSTCFGQLSHLCYRTTHRAEPTLDSILWRYGTHAGSFLDRTYTFKAGWGDTIARVRRAPELVSDLDTYVVDVAAGVDAAAILAMAVIIDEDHDEEDAKRAKEEASGGGGWPFG